MKPNHRLRKHRNNVFQTYRDTKTANNVPSIQDKQVLDDLKNLEKGPMEQRFLWPRAKSFKQSKNIKVNLNLAANFSIMELGNELKTKRTLIEENNQLKRKLESLSSMKVAKKQVTSKKISTEFEKQLYWNGPQAHMITGVKNQYQKMKQSYAKKCDEYEELLKSVAVSSTIQFIAYIQTLELENHKLARKLQNKSKSLQFMNNQELQDLTNRVLQDHNQKFELRFQKCKQKLKAIKKQNKELKNKILFLEKLLIEKDNNEQYSKRNAKRFEKEKTQLQIKYKNLEVTLKDITNQNNLQLQNLKINHAQILAQEKQNQILYKRQQQQYIVRLQKQNKYLQSLVQSWKEQKTQKKESKRQSSFLKQKMDKTQSMAVEGSNQRIEPITLTNNKFQSIQSPSKLSQREEQQPDFSPPQNTRKVPYTADNKNSQNSVKNRRVQPHQIQQAIQYARLILIAKGLNVDWALQQFESKEDEWSKQFISMKQVKQIWEQKLHLSKNSSHMIARYLIQHSNQEHVYTDDINEHDRTVVKSILKNLLGNYSVYEKEKQEFQKLLSDWKIKLQWAFQNTSKGDFISKDKFLDLIQSLSLNTPGFGVYCLSKMALHSQSLQKLQFKQLFGQITKQ